MFGNYLWSVLTWKEHVFLYLLLVGWTGSLTVMIMKVITITLPTLIISDTHHTWTYTFTQYTYIYVYAHTHIYMYICIYCILFNQMCSKEAKEGRWIGKKREVKIDEEDEENDQTGNLSLSLSLSLSVRIWFEFGFSLSFSILVWILFEFGIWCVSDLDLL